MKLFESRDQLALTFLDQYEALRQTVGLGHMQWVFKSSFDCDILSIVAKFPPNSPSHFPPFPPPSLVPHPQPLPHSIRSSGAPTNLFAHINSLLAKSFLVLSSWPRRRVGSPREPHSQELLDVLIQQPKHSYF